MSVIVQLIRARSGYFAQIFRLRNLTFVSMIMSVSACIYLLLRLLETVSLDVDAHHDGIVLSTTVAMQEGRLPYRDYFLMYGVFSDLANDLGTQVFFWLSPILALRTTSLILLVLTPLPMLALRSTWAYRALVISAMSVMLSLSDINYGVSFIPWSNLLLNALLVLLIRLVLVSDSTIRERPIPYWWSWVALTVFLCLVKPQFLVLLLLVPLLAPTSNLAKTFIKRSMFLLLSGATCLAGLAVVLPSIISPAWTFIVELPRNDYWTASLNYFSNFFIQLLRRDLLVVLSFMLAGFTFSLKNLSRRIRTRIALPAGAFILFSVFDGLKRQKLTWVASQIEYSSQSPRVLELVFLSLLASLAGVGCAHLVMLCRDVSTFDSRMRKEVVLVAIGLVSLSQFAPVPDTRHAWYAIVPVLFAVCAISLLRNIRTSSVVVAGFVAAMLSVFLLRDTESDWRTYLALPRVAAESSLLSGTRSRLQIDVERLHQQRVLNADQDIQLLKTGLSDSEDAVFVVDDALFTVFDGTWRSVDKWQVQWELTEALELRLAASPDAPVVLQIANTTIDSWSARQTLRAKGYREVGRGTRIAIYRSEAAKDLSGENLIITP